MTLSWRDFNNVLNSIKTMWFDLLKYTIFTSMTVTFQLHDCYLYTLFVPDIDVVESLAALICSKWSEMFLNLPLECLFLLGCVNSRAAEPRELQLHETRHGHTGSTLMCLLCESNSVIYGQPSWNRCVSNRQTSLLIKHQMALIGLEWIKCLLAV